MTGTGRASILYYLFLISFYAWPENSPEYIKSKNYYYENNLSAPEWNGGIDSRQIEWLETLLHNADSTGKNVMIFSHFPLIEDEKHELWNSKEIYSLLIRHPSVKAYFCGHNHKGQYIKKAGIHFLTFPALLETDDTTAYAIVKLAPDSIIIDGIGRCPSYSLSINSINGI